MATDYEFNVESVMSLVIGLVMVITIFPVVMNMATINNIPTVVHDAVNETKHLGTNILMKTEKFDVNSVSGNQTQIPLWQISLVVIMIVCFIYVIVRNLKDVRKKLKW
jgi:hypothetical protein